jgi:hypothetical protein
MEYTMAKLSEAMLQALKLTAESGEGHVVPGTLVKRNTLEALQKRGLMTLDAGVWKITDAGKEALALNGGWKAQDTEPNKLGEVLEGLKDMTMEEYHDTLDEIVRDASNSPKESDDSQDADATEEWFALNQVNQGVLENETPESNGTQTEHKLLNGLQDLAVRVKEAAWAPTNRKGRRAAQRSLRAANRRAAKLRDKKGA